MKFGIPSLFKRRWFQFLCVLLLIFGGYFYWQNSHKQAEEIATHTVVTSDIKETIKASGRVTAEKQASVRFQAPGQLVWVGAKKGDTVTQWQALASLDQRELEQTLKQSLLTYMNTRMDFEQKEDDYDDTTVTDEIKRILTKNQNALDSAVIDVEIADLAKKYATIYAPIDGILIKATDEYPGVNTTATTEYVVVDPNTLRFSADVEETDIGRIEVGDSVQVTLDAFSDQDISGTITSIDFTPTQTTSGNTAYRAHIPLAPDARLRLDMNGDVDIIINQKSQVLTVPIEAVTENENKKMVTLLRANNVKETVEIETGIETDEVYEVVKGLQEGDVVILP